MIPKQSDVLKTRSRYHVGARVVLVFMNDAQAPPVGTKGTVTHVDDIGTIHVKWDNGSTLGVVWGEDRVWMIEED